MKWMGIIFVSVVFFFFVGYYSTGFIENRFLKKSVLSEKIEVVPTETPTPTQTPTPSPTVTLTPRPTNTPTPTPVPQPKVTSSEIHALLERFAGQYAVDVNVLRAIAVCESGFNPSAVNGPYAGLFQFNKTTWKNGRILMGEDPNYDLRFNAEEAVQTAAYLISQGKRYLWPNCNP